MKVLLEFIRGLVRPVVTVGWLAGALVLLFTDTAVPDWYIAQLATIITWWFADRSRKHNGTPNGGG